MTFGARTFQGVSGNNVTPPVNTLVNVSASIGTRSVGVQMNTDGSVTVTNGSGDTQWYNPITTSIGNLYWVQCDITSISNTNNFGTFGSPLALTSLRGWSFQNSATNNEGTGTYRLSFYTDALGTQLVGQSIGSWDVGHI